MPALCVPGAAPGRLRSRHRRQAGARPAVSRRTPRSQDTPPASSAPGLSASPLCFRGRAAEPGTHSRRPCKTRSDTCRVSPEPSAATGSGLALSPSRTSVFPGQAQHSPRSRTSEAKSRERGRRRSGKGGGGSAPSGDALMLRDGAPRLLSMRAQRVPARPPSAGRGGWATRSAWARTVGARSGSRAQGRAQQAAGRRDAPTLPNRPASGAIRRPKGRRASRKGRRPPRRAGRAGGAIRCCASCGRTRPARPATRRDRRG